MMAHHAHRHGDMRSCQCHSEGAGVPLSGPGGPADSGVRQSASRFCRWRRELSGGLGIAAPWAIEAAPNAAATAAASVGGRFWARPRRAW
jgi:hypothetical protein